jgi:hypothetical protein
MAFPRILKSIERGATGGLMHERMKLGVSAVFGDVGCQLRSSWIIGIRGGFDIDLRPSVMVQNHVRFIGQDRRERCRGEKEWCGRKKIGLMKRLLHIVVQPIDVGM